MPWRDWQFWVVTVVSLTAVAVVVRPLLPTRRSGTGCPKCASRPKPRKTSITVDGRRTR